MVIFEYIKDKTALINAFPTIIFIESVFENP